jgi:micrococcal nuclease
VIDGDTIRSDEERIRLEGIDAAEIGMRNARLSAAWRFSPSTGWNNCSARALSISGGMHTRSRRIAMALARVLVDGEDVACILIKEGYARPGTGRREVWCQSLDRRDHAEATLSCAVTY